MPDLIDFVDVFADDGLGWEDIVVALKAHGARVKAETVRRLVLGIRRRR